MWRWAWPRGWHETLDEVSVLKSCLCCWSLQGFRKPLRRQGISWVSFSKTDEVLVAIVAAEISELFFFFFLLCVFSSFVSMIENFWAWQPGLAVHTPYPGLQRGREFGSFPRSYICPSSLRFIAYGCGRGGRWEMASAVLSKCKREDTPYGLVMKLPLEY